VPCPEPLYDAGGARLGSRLFVVAGYRRVDAVNDRIFVFDLERKRWAGSLPRPQRVAHSHAAVCADGERMLYVVSGQLGPDCRPAIADGHAYDVGARSWSRLPDLPAPRYAGTMQLLGGRLHFVGGAEPDRYTPSADHWSLAVEGGRALEAGWREEAPVPLAAMHRGSAVVEGSLYVFGGQQGDFVAVAGDPSCGCTGETEELYFPDVYRLRPGGGGWERLSDLLVPVSHTDSAVVVDGPVVHVVGGQMYKRSDDFRLRLTGVVQSYDVRCDRWSMAGTLPFRLKTTVCAAYRGSLVCATGQRDGGSRWDWPGRVVDQTWLAALPAPAAADVAGVGVPPLARVERRNVVLVSHELTLTGAPLHLLETAVLLRESGAAVRLFTLADDAVSHGIADRHRIPVLPFETATDWAARADLVIAGTAQSGPWVRDFLGAHPEAADRLVWWIHENDPDTYGRYVAGTDAVRTLVFDSHAASAAWGEGTFPETARRFCIHPANRSALVAESAAERLAWPVGSARRRLTRAEIRARLGLRDDEFVFLCVGTYVPHKGQALLIRMVGRLFAERPDLGLRLLLVGFEDERQRQAVLRTLSAPEKAALNDGRLAILEQPAVAPFYRAADAFVLNTQGRGEPFGRVTIEAMAFALPVLATEAGGTTEIVVDGQTGLLHPVGEAGLDVLAEHVTRLAGNRDEAARMGAAGRARAIAHFSEVRFCADLDYVVTSVLDDTAQARAAAPTALVGEPGPGAGSNLAQRAP
jgi:glycosyltransferase involved in cell wall biosynthesis